MIVSTLRHIRFSTLPLGPPMGSSLAWRHYFTMSSQNYNLLHSYYKLSAINSLITHLDFEQFCAGSGSSWGPAISPIRPETPGGGPSSPTYLLCELPFGSERWIEGSISRSEQLERTAQLLAACLEQKKKKHISWRQQFTSFYWLSCLSETILSEQYLQHVHFSKRHTKEFTHSSRSER